MINPTITAIVNYLICFLADGDYNNDWLSHLPGDIADLLQAVCHLVYIVFNPLI